MPSNLGSIILVIVVIVLIIVILFTEYGRLTGFTRFFKKSLKPQEGDDVPELIQRLENNIFEPTPRVYWRRAFLIALGGSFIISYWLLRRIPTVVEYVTTFLVFLVLIYFCYSFYDYHDMNVYRTASRENIHKLREKLGIQKHSEVGVESTLS
jgi:uncharacterized membrane protein